MKLKNRETGEINELKVAVNGDLAITKDDEIIGIYSSLAELNEEWCDYEEPKGNWTIDPMNENYIDDGKYTAPDELERYEELGLKFNTEEEAEKAVEKLKAWERLRDKGFRLNAVVDTFFCLDIFMKDEPYETIKDDLKIVFGGEE